MKRTCFTLAVLCMLLTGVIVQADDVEFLRPDWRGDDRTLTAGWDFFVQDSTWGPISWTLLEWQLIQATPGGFGAQFPAWAHINSSVWVFQNLHGRQGVVELEGTEDYLGFRLVNYAGGDQKEMVVQITFYSEGNGPLNFTVGTFPTDPGNPPWQLFDTRPAVVAGVYYHGDGWQTNKYIVNLEPNPQYEGLAINIGYGAVCYIDQVVIDTRCSETAPPPPPPPPPPLPAVSAAGMIALVFVLALGLIIVSRRKRASIP